MCKWRVGDRCVTTIPVGYPSNCHPTATKDVLGHVSHIYHRFEGLPGNAYVVKLDQPIKYYGGIEQALLLYTSKDMRKISGGLR